MILRVVLVAIALTAAAGAEQFKSGVDAVYMDLTVQAPEGSIGRGLTKDDFQVYEENVPQDVAVFSAEPAPISVGVLIDTSGSMTGERIEKLRGQMSNLLMAMQNAANAPRYGIVIFNDGPESCFPGGGIDHHLG